MRYFHKNCCPFVFKYIVDVLSELRVILWDNPFNKNTIFLWFLNVTKPIINKSILSEDVNDKV